MKAVMTGRLLISGSGKTGQPGVILGFLNKFTPKGISLFFSEAKQGQDL